jgi:hypothetical protein
MYSCMGVDNSYSVRSIRGGWVGGPFSENCETLVERTDLDKSHTKNEGDHMFSRIVHGESCSNIETWILICRSHL